MAYPKPQILALSGSLRTGSSTHAVLNIIAGYTVGKAIFKVYDNLENFPHFNDSPEAPTEVEHFRQSIRSADGILICTPEYAFGVPGTLKNALDWTVSSGEFVNKPTALITAATGGNNAHAALLLTLTALSANIPKDARLLISFIRSKLNEQGEMKDQQTLQLIHNVVDSLIKNCILSRDSD